MERSLALVTCGSPTCSMHMTCAILQIDQMHTMLGRLEAYAKRKGLNINADKYEVVHFNSNSLSVPAFSGGCSDSQQ